jgi:hypothetical protein
MKIRLTFKTPDAFYRAIEENNCERVNDRTLQNIQDCILQWVDHNEYLTVEFDTQDGSCTPIPVRKFRKEI